MLKPYFCRLAVYQILTDWQGFSRKKTFFFFFSRKRHIIDLQSHISVLESGLWSNLGLWFSSDCDVFCVCHSSITFRTFNSGMTSRRISTKIHNLPQLTTTYRQKAPIAQYVRRIDAQIAVRFCAICSIYIMPRALGDILTVSILIGGCVFYSPSLPCVCRHFAASIPTLHRGKMAKWRHTQGKLGEQKTHPPIKILTVKISPRALGMI